MHNYREILKVQNSIPTMEGAGVKLKRVFGHNDVTLLDPFLMLDDFHSNNPQDYIAGFPWHPHRGIETVTYIISGSVKHEDSLGNSGIINKGEIQWMTSGSGIIHSEMPQQEEKLLWGFQLWVNLPAKYKMMKPRYQDIKSENIPEIIKDNGTKIKIISGNLDNIEGPVKDIVVDIEFLDIFIPANNILEHNVNKDHSVFAYVIEGSGYFDTLKKNIIKDEKLVIFREGDKIIITTLNDNIRFLLISGKPLKEPIAWYGPIVMNTEEELRIAFEEYNNGTFIKK